MRSKLKFLLLLTVVFSFLLTSNVYAMGHVTDQDGSSGGTYDGGGEGTYTNVPLALRYSMMIKASLVEIANNSTNTINTVSHHFYYTSKKSDGTNVDLYNILTGSRNLAGANKVCGNILNGNVHAVVENDGTCFDFRSNSTEVKLKDNWFLDGFASGANVSSDKIRKHLDNQDNWFQLLVDLKLATKVLKKSADSKEVLQGLTSEEVHTLNQNYRVIIEPVYTFERINRSNWTRTYTYYFFTLKGAAKWMANEGYKSGRFGVIADTVVYELYATEQHGYINQPRPNYQHLLGDPTQDNNGVEYNSWSTINFERLSFASNGYGYGVHYIIGEECDPTKACCYDDKGNYDPLKVGNKENYKCSDVNDDKSCDIANLVQCGNPSILNRKPNCPEGEYDDIYNVYYMFVAGVDEYTKTLETGADSAIINDSQIFSRAGKTYQHTIDVGDEYDITAANVGWFYDKLALAESRSDRVYYDEAAKSYYVTHASYCEDGECYASKRLTTGTDSNRQQFLNASIYSSSTTIERRSNDDATGNAFTIERRFTPGFKTNMSGGVASKYTYNNLNMYLHPVVYLVKFCYSGRIQQPSCEDTVTTAVCEDEDIGTTATFHENNDIAACTIPKAETGDGSGFTIVETNETKPVYISRNPYCEVACKDDIDIELPTAKETAAGQYFVLNNYTPKIHAKRTCATTEIDYAAFAEDFKEAEEQLIYTYNIWQDWLAYKNYFDANIRYDTDVWSDTKSKLGYNYGVVASIKHDENTEESECDCDEEGNCSHEECDWAYDDWNITFTPPNYGTIETAGCDGSTYCYPCSGEQRECEWTRAQEGEQTDEKVAELEQDYIDARNNYNDLFKKYKSCSNWITEMPFAFKPIVTFYYPDDDATIFNKSKTYTFNYNDTEEVEKETKTVNTFWTWENRERINNTYKIGGTSYEVTSNVRTNKQKLLNDGVLVSWPKYACTGNSCFDDSSENEFYTSAYIKREEDITYKYHLPTVISYIPSGKVALERKSTSNYDYNILEEDAVPININTSAGNYNYKISITDIEDTVRDSKKRNNRDDNFTDRFERNTLNDGSTYVCEYDVVNDVYIPDQKFNFFYRTVDPDDINPLDRELGYNWSDARAETVRERMKEAEADYQVLTNSDDRDKFTFTLTPTIMKQIREYNSTRNSAVGGTDGGGYADWDLVCADYEDSRNGYHCYSNFLTCFASGGGRKESGISTSCNSIFGNTLNGYEDIQSYDDVALDNNREILIEKQNALDGRG